MVAQEIKINCAECIKGNHNNCTHENCLCRADKHGESLRYGVKADHRMSRPLKEPMEYEQALRDAHRLESILENGLGNNSPAYTLIELTKLFILSKHLVSKFDLVNNLKEWCIKYRVELNEVDDAIDIVFSDMDMFECIKKISKCLGNNKKDVIFDSTQLIEVSEWLKGRYHIKRIELTGDLLFWNEQYYERDAEALIRRKARERIAKSKNTDMNEIVRYIEDTCKLITWKDIESSIHLKCLNNGIYDIKTGIFSSKFSPDYIILNKIPHDYNEDESWDTINESVRSLIPNDVERQSFYDFLSTCMHPYTGIDFQFGFVGRSGTGKSQLGILADLTFGEDNISDASIHLIAKDSTTQKDCAFKMLNIDYDLSDESIQKTDTLKKWITQDKMTGRGIYEHSSTYRPMSRLLFNANELYEIPNDENASAIYDRTWLVRVDKRVRHQDIEVKRFMEKAATIPQLSGFVTYLLKNATWIYDNESYHHKINLQQVEDIWNTFGNRIKMFIDKWIERGVSYRVESPEPFNKWMSWCIQKGYKSKDKKQFSKIFDEIIGNTPTKTRIEGNECYAYSGFRIKTDEEIADEETTPFNVEKGEEALKALLFSSVENISKIFEKILRESNRAGAFRAFEDES